MRRLFILWILDDTERSIVLSPISTMSPPMMSGLTWRDVSFVDE